MSWVTDEFLSTTRSEWIHELTTKYGRILQIAREVSAMGIALGRRGIQKKLKPEPELDEYTMQLLLHARAKTHLQTVIILMEQGLVIEASVILRSLLEVAFYSCVLTELGQAFIDRFKHSLVKAEKSKIQALLRTPDELRLYLNKNTKAELNEVLRYIQSVSSVKADMDLETIASEAKMAPLYLSYKKLSANPAHITIESLYRCFLQPNGVGERMILTSPLNSEHYFIDVVMEAAIFFIYSLRGVALATNQPEFIHESSEWILRVQANGCVNQQEIAKTGQKSVDDFMSEIREKVAVEKAKARKI